ncbi:MAG: hypothetical protein ACLFV7_11695 [Phycisphaerae bacterium]
MAALVVGCESSDKESTVQGKAGQKLTIDSPEDVTVTRGEVAEVDITVTRKDIKGNVAVEFSDLPQGVTVLNSDKQIVGNDASYKLEVSETATPVANHVAKVTATAVESDIGVTQTFRINIEEQE